MKQPSICIGALKGGSGKTLISLGLIAAWREKGLEAAPFKKGPDFIDAGWLAFAAGRLCYNLDTFLMNQDQILGSFISHSKGAHLCVVEGNRGLYDGLDMEGRCSTAELAKLLKIPVLICVDVTMATRTVAAVVKGCQAFDPDLNLAGVILNRVAGSRQEGLIRGAIERYCGLPVVGAVPKLKKDALPERHMGLVPYQERAHAQKAIKWTLKTAQENLDLDRIREISNRVEGVEPPSSEVEEAVRSCGSSDGPRIGYIQDRAFWFYYPENLEKIEKMGGTLIRVDALRDHALPVMDALYIGGGFPETQAEALADNRVFRRALREGIEKGLPVYAECGGFMYLGEKLVVNGTSFPMVGAVPMAFILKKKPQGHGYTILKVDRPNPFYKVGETIKGHEFHYSEPLITQKNEASFAFQVRRGQGIDGIRDGFCKKNLLATYSHVHAAGDTLWAERILRAAQAYKKEFF